MAFKYMSSDGEFDAVEVQTQATKKPLTLVQGLKKTHKDFGPLPPFFGTSILVLP
jgi:hypothetical protein